jgi:hypothetical protein
VSLSANLCLGVVDSIVSRLQLAPVAGETADAVRVLRSPMVPDAPVGYHRVWRGKGVDLQYIGLTVPMIGLDSHMLFAFTSPTSPVPHFTLDSVAGGGAPGQETSYAFHLDLLPKMDLGAHLGYLRHCFEPLSAIRGAAQEIPGLEAAHLSLTQYAVMSPWMVVHRASEDAFSAVTPSVHAYRDHWLSLVEHQVPAEVLDGVSPEQIAIRDLRNRQIVFDPSVDPVWARVSQLVGSDTSEALRSSLANPLA